MDRRAVLRTMTACGGMSFLGLNPGMPGIGQTAASADEKSQAASGQSGIVHVVVFSNFEGHLHDASRAIKWFDDCSAAYPSIQWSHMFNPGYLVMKSPKWTSAAAAYLPYLLKAQAAGHVEVGLHLHMFYDLIQEMGVTARAFPYAGDATADCSEKRAVGQNPNDGYDVLMTGYSADEQAKLLDVGVEAFLAAGFAKPTSFCAGYSAADPQLQAIVARKGFTTSFSAQIIPPDHYGSCWEKLLKWSGHITPLTMPYRVAQGSILPPPHSEENYLDLVEVPLNMGVDTNDLFLRKTRVTRVDMFERHYNWALQTGRETMVAIGVHADVIANETWGEGPVFKIFDSFLSHVAARAKEGPIAIHHGKVSDVAARFRDNKSLAGVPF